jgi:hypothetical protein
VVDFCVGLLRKHCLFYSNFLWGGINPSVSGKRATPLFIWTCI